MSSYTVVTTVSIIITITQMPLSMPTEIASGIFVPPQKSDYSYGGGFPEATTTARSTGIIHWKLTQAPAVYRSQLISKLTVLSRPEILGITSLGRDIPGSNQSLARTRYNSTNIPNDVEWVPLDSRDVEAFPVDSKTTTNIPVYIIPSDSKTTNSPVYIMPARSTISTVFYMPPSSLNRKFSRFQALMGDVVTGGKKKGTVTLPRVKSTSRRVTNISQTLPTVNVRLLNSDLRPRTSQLQSTPRVRSFKVSGKVVGVAPSRSRGLLSKTEAANAFLSRFPSGFFDKRVTTNKNATATPKVGSKRPPSSVFLTWLSSSTPAPFKVDDNDLEQHLLSISQSLSNESEQDKVKEVEPTMKGSLSSKTQSSPLLQAEVKLPVSSGTMVILNKFKGMTPFTKRPTFHTTTSSPPKLRNTSYDITSSLKPSTKAIEATTKLPNKEFPTQQQVETTTKKPGNYYKSEKSTTKIWIPIAISTPPPKKDFSSTINDFEKPQYATTKPHLGSFGFVLSTTTVKSSINKYPYSLSQILNRTKLTYFQKTPKPNWHSAGLPSVSSVAPIVESLLSNERVENKESSLWTVKNDHYNNGGKPVSSATSFSWNFDAPKTSTSYIYKATSSPNYSNKRSTLPPSYLIPEHKFTPTPVPFPSTTYKVSAHPIVVSALETTSKHTVYGSKPAVVKPTTYEKPANYEQEAHEAVKDWNSGTSDEDDYQVVHHQPLNPYITPNYEPVNHVYLTTKAPYPVVAVHHSPSTEYYSKPTISPNYPNYKPSGYEKPHPSLPPQGLYINNRPHYVSKPKPNKPSVVSNAYGRPTTARPVYQKPKPKPTTAYYPPQFGIQGSPTPYYPQYTQAPTLSDPYQSPPYGVSNSQYHTPGSSSLSPTQLQNLVNLLSNSGYVVSSYNNGSAISEEYTYEESGDVTPDYTEAPIAQTGGRNDRLKRLLLAIGMSIIPTATIAIVVGFPGLLMGRKRRSVSSTEEQLTQLSEQVSIAIEKYLGNLPSELDMDSITAVKDYCSTLLQSDRTGKGMNLFSNSGDSRQWKTLFDHVKSFLPRLKFNFNRFKLHEVPPKTHYGDGIVYFQANETKTWWPSNKAKKPTVNNSAKLSGLKNQSAPKNTSFNLPEIENLVTANINLEEVICSKIIDFINGKPILENESSKTSEAKINEIHFFNLPDPTLENPTVVHLASFTLPISVQEAMNQTLLDSLIHQTIKKVNSETKETTTEKNTESMAVEETAEENSETSEMTTEADEQFHIANKAEHGKSRRRKHGSSKNRNKGGLIVNSKTVTIPKSNGQNNEPPMLLILYNDHLSDPGVFKIAPKQEKMLNVSPDVTEITESNHSSKIHGTEEAQKVLEKHSDKNYQDTEMNQSQEIIAEHTISHRRSKDMRDNDEKTVDVESNSYTSRRWKKLDNLMQFYSDSDADTYFLQQLMNIPMKRRKSRKHKRRHQRQVAFDNELDEYHKFWDQRTVAKLPPKKPIVYTPQHLFGNPKLRKGMEILLQKMQQHEHTNPQKDSNKRTSSKVSSNNETESDRTSASKLLSSFKGRKFSSDAFDLKKIVNDVQEGKLYIYHVLMGNKSEKSQNKKKKPITTTSRTTITTVDGTSTNTSMEADSLEITEKPKLKGPTTVKPKTSTMSPHVKTTVHPSTKKPNPSGLNAYRGRLNFLSNPANNIGGLATIIRIPVAIENATPDYMDVIGNPLQWPFVQLPMPLPLVNPPTETNHEPPNVQNYPAYFQNPFPYLYHQSTTQRPLETATKNVSQNTDDKSSLVVSNVVPAGNANSSSISGPTTINIYTIHGINRKLLPLIKKATQVLADKNVGQDEGQDADYDSSGDDSSESDPITQLSYYNKRPSSTQLPVRLPVFRPTRRPIISIHTRRTTTTTAASESLTTKITRPLLNRPRPGVVRPAAQQVDPCDNCIVLSTRRPQIKKTTPKAFTLLELIGQKLGIKTHGGLIPLVELGNGDPWGDVWNFWDHEVWTTGGHDKRALNATAKTNNKRKTQSKKINKQKA